MAKDPWEAVLGQRLRTLRVDRELTQHELADRANVSVGAVKHLETGSGATTTTLAKVVRALGQESWIDALATPAPVFSPLELLDQRRRAARKAKARTRVRHPSHRR